MILLNVGGFFLVNKIGINAADVITDHEWLKGDFITTVQKRGAAIIKARGASSAASAANAIVDNVYNMTHDTPAGETFSLCRCSNGEYGVQEGLIFSYPCRTEGGVVKVVEGIEHNEFGQEKFDITHKELATERETVQSMGLI